MPPLKPFSSVFGNREEDKNDLKRHRGQPRDGTWVGGGGGVWGSRFVVRRDLQLPTKRRPK